MTAAPDDDDDDMKKLANILGMLGSEHDGEVLNAARAAEKFRRETGRTWQQLLCKVDPVASMMRYAQWDSPYGGDGIKPTTDEVCWLWKRFGHCYTAATPRVRAMFNSKRQHFDFT